MTVDETHTHGPLAELIFYLRTLEARVRTLEMVLKESEQANATLRAWNAKYFGQIYGKETPPAVAQGSADDSRVRSES